MPVGRVIAFEEGYGRNRIVDRLLAIQSADHFARLVLIGRRSARRREEIRCQSHETLQRHATGDIADMRIEAAVLVDDDDGGQFA